jgi:outer membrane protein assembly factor BamA
MNTRSMNWVIALLLPIQCLAQSADAPQPEQLQVQEVRCDGNSHTSCDFIRQHLYLKPGETLSEEEIRNAQLRLGALRRFDSVDVRLEKGRERGAVVVVIQVEEADPIVTEWLLGVSSRQDTNHAVFAGRIAHDSLFGDGEILDLSGVAVLPEGGDAYSEIYDVTLRYADPQLFGSRRYFGVASVGWRKQRFLDKYGNFGYGETPRFDLTVGWRFGDFSYFAYGLTYRRDNDAVIGHWNDDGTFTYYQPNSDDPSSSRLIYGWSTEDDVHFPTQGTALQIMAGGDYEADEPLGRQHFKFRKTWAAAGSYWTFKIGGEPSLEYRTTFGESQLMALSFARPVASGDQIRRGRWYVEPGLAFVSYNSAGDLVAEYGLKAGFRADTRMFGYVDLYLLATRDTTL